MLTQTLLMYPMLFRPVDDQIQVTVPDFNDQWVFNTTDELVAVQLSQKRLKQLMKRLDPSQYPKPQNVEDSKWYQKYPYAKVIYLTVEPRPETSYDMKAMRKSVTIPKYLNDWGIAQHVNFSQVLTNALQQQFKTR